MLRLHPRRHTDQEIPLEAAREAARTGDYQWPSAVSLPAAFLPSKITAPRHASLERRVESFFEDRLRCHAVLTSSARSGLSLILRRHGINRSHIVYVPKWVSHCLWDVVGRYSNPSPIYQGPDVALAVHKWGQAARLPPNYAGLAIEDSVDSIFTSPRALFPNKGAYELISLPKTIGSYCGGVVLTREASAARELRKMRREAFLARPGVAKDQTRLKYFSAKSRGRSHMQWEYLEYLAPRLDGTGAAHVAACLDNWDLNARTIHGRITTATRLLPWISRYAPRGGRLPPVLTIPRALFGKSAQPPSLMTRHHDFSGRASNPTFEPALLLPLHLGIDDKWFGRLLSELENLSLLRKAEKRR